LIENPTSETLSVPEPPEQDPIVLDQFTTTLTSVTTYPVGKSVVVILTGNVEMDDPLA
jgi:hypothetical protein